MSGEAVDSLRKRAQNEATCFALNDLLKEVQAERDKLRAELAAIRASEPDVQALVEALKKFRECFVIAVGDKSPFCRCALEPVDAALATYRKGK